MEDGSFGSQPPPDGGSLVGLEDEIIKTLELRPVSKQEISVLQKDLEVWILKKQKKVENAELTMLQRFALFAGASYVGGYVSSWIILKRILLKGGSRGFTGGLGLVLPSLIAGYFTSTAAIYYTKPLLFRKWLTLQTPLASHMRDTVSALRSSGQNCSESFPDSAAEPSVWHQEIPRSEYFKDSVDGNVSPFEAERPNSSFNREFDDLVDNSLPDPSFSPTPWNFSLNQEDENISYPSDHLSDSFTSNLPNPQSGRPQSMLKTWEDIRNESKL